jgi:putative membrane protein
MSFILSWLVLALAVWVTAELMPSVHVRSFKNALIVAAVFGILNFFLGKLFFVFFGVVTLGIAWLLSFVTRWLIDAIILSFTDSLIGDFRVDSFGSALIAAAIMSLLGTAGQWALVLVGLG